MQAIQRGGLMLDSSEKAPTSYPPQITIEQFQDVLHQISEGIIEVNAHGYCSYANPKALTYLGIDELDKIIGTPISQHISFNKTFSCDSSLEYVNQLAHNTNATRKGYLLSQKGEIIDILTWKQPFSLNDGDGGSVIGFTPEASSAPSNLNTSIDRYKLLIESTQVVLWEYDLSSNHFTFVSPQAEALFGYPIRLWYTKGFWEEKIHNEDRARVVETCQALSKENASYELEYRMIKADGQVLYVHDYVSVVSQSGNQIALRGIFADISEQKLSEEQLRLSAIVFESSDAVIVTDKKQNIIQVNNAFTRITGYESHEVIGHKPSIISSGKQSKEFYKKLWYEINNNHHWQGEIWNKRKNGEIYAEWLTITPVFDDQKKICNYVGIFSDISEKKETEKEIEFRNTHDALTKLPNRVMLYRKLKDAIENSKRNGTQGALLFLDLDEFKLVNDSMGHSYGDELLKQVAQRLRTCLSTGDILARIGGDEFAILIPSISLSQKQGESCINSLSKNIQNIFSKAFRINNRQLHISTSIGISTFPESNEHSSDVLRKADTAMFRAKESGKNQVKSFTPDMHQRIERHLMIHNELSQAIQRNELSMNFQPLYDENENLVTAEALLRWDHPLYGSISPSEFIPIAEQTGLIIPLGNFVIDTVCKLMKDWREHNELFIKRIDINVSCQQFDDEFFYENLKNKLEQYDIPPSQLGLELTEEVMIGDINRIIDLFTRLKKLGTHFSIDDFGTGYSSLRYIKRIPIDNLKIDQSFIKDIPHDHSDCIMVNTIIAMARQMNLTVTAEGIETLEQKQFLKNLKCDYYQGFLFNKPLSVVDFEKIVLSKD